MYFSRKNNSLLIFVALFTIFNFTIAAQTVTIQGNVDSSYFADSATIYAYTYYEYTAYKEKELSHCLVDSKGNFSLNFSIKVPTFVFLILDNAKAEMIAEPNKNYQISFLARDSNSVRTLSTLNPVEIEFKNSDTHELNFLMADFSSRYESFLQDYRGEIAKKKSSVFAKIDTIEILFKNKYKAFQHPYLYNHIEYTFAALKQNLSLGDGGILFDKYINAKKVQLDNYDYMKFIHLFYSNSINAMIDQPNLIMEINQKQNYPSLINCLSHSKYLTNDTLKEIVLLRTLLATTGNSNYNPLRVSAIADTLQKHLIVNENINAAKSIQKSLACMKPGTKAPLFVFKNNKGKSVSLNDFKGNYVYLTFWASWCSTCSQELFLIPNLKKMYGSKIKFITICLDKKPEAMQKFLEKNKKIDWPFLYCDNYKFLKENYNVLTVPTYYLLDTKGNVLISPAPNPQDIEATFNHIKKK